jgi:hypothetical protein
VHGKFLLRKRNIPDKPKTLKIRFVAKIVRKRPHDFILRNPSRFGSVVAHPDLDGEVSGSRLGHTKNFKNGTYCSSASAGHNKLE